MVKIRLMRVGKRKQPSFRVVVADSRSPRDGRIIETIGHYHPREDPSVIEINGERAVHWLQLGAQPSNTVKNLLRITGAWSEFSGEAPPPPYGEAPAKKTTPVKATPAASVSEEAVAAETEEGLEAGATPEGPESIEEVPEDAVPAEETAEMPSIDEDVAETTEDDEAK
jgi:small subunit ribosomal protein S16